MALVAFRREAALAGDHAVVIAGVIGGPSLHDRALLHHRATTAPGPVGMSFSRHRGVVNA